MNHKLDGANTPWEGAILEERVAHCKLLGLSAVRCAATAKPIDLPFGLWTLVGRRKHKFNRICQVVPMCPHGRGHIGATLRMQLNHPRAPAMRSYVKLLRPLAIDVPDCGVRDSRPLESQQGQLCLSRQPLRYKPWAQAKHPYCSV